MSAAKSAAHEVLAVAIDPIQRSDFPRHPSKETRLSPVSTILAA